MDTWHEIVVKDPNNLSGASVRSFVGEIIERFDIRWVCSADVEGAASRIGALNEIVESREFLDLVGRAHQYDWAFFFMFASRPPHLLIHENDKERLRTADVTVRLVDDAFFFVYTRRDDVALAIQKSYPAAIHSLFQFENLKVPY